MPEIIEMCKTLIAKGSAYDRRGNVWFDVTKDADYGKLSHRSVEEQESGQRTLEGAGKTNPSDFALWKAAKPGEPAWDSPWGKGQAGVAHRVLGDEREISGRDVRHSRRRDGSDVSAS